MRVCVLQPVLDPFKGANHLPLFAANADINFTILCSRCKVPQRDLPANVEVVELGGWLGTYYYGCMDLRFAQIVLRAYQSDDPFWQQFAVLHCNQVMGPSLSRLKRTGLPIILTIHHPVTVDCALAVEETPFLQSVHWRLKYAAPIVWQRAMCSVADAIVTVSATVRDRLVQDYGCDPANVVIVPNGVDGNVFQPVDAPEEYDVIALGSLMHPRKGFRYLVDAYRQLASSGRRIADVGRRSDSQLRELRFIPNVTVHGTVDAPRLIQLLQRSKTLISTSLYEGFGLSLIEALACGIPAFAFGGGAVGEVLVPIDPSLITPIRDTGKLVQRVQGFLHLSVPQRKRRGDRYRSLVLDTYPLERSAEALRELYQRYAGRPMPQ
jgi:glycosyltransferase involved in cell wall biosynthesis